jgi:hypothetical protein
MMEDYKFVKKQAQDLKPGDTVLMTVSNTCTPEAREFTSVMFAFHGVDRRLMRDRLVEVLVSTKIEPGCQAVHIGGSPAYSVEAVSKDGVYAFCRLPSGSYLSVLVDVLKRVS